MAGTSLDDLKAATRARGVSAAALAAHAAHLFGLPPAADPKAALAALDDAQRGVLVAALAAGDLDPPPAAPPAPAGRTPLELLPVPIGPRGLAPRNLAEVAACAEYLYRAGVCPPGIANREELGVVILAGMDVGLSAMQSAANIMVQNGRPVIWGDAILALLHASGALVRYEEVDVGTPGGPDAGIELRLWRRGHAEPFVGRWTRADSERAGLVNRVDKKGRAFDSTHEKFPRDMAFRRALSRAAQRGFADRLRGIGVRDDPPGDDAEDRPGGDVLEDIEAVVAADAPAPGAAPPAEDAATSAEAPAPSAEEVVDLDGAVPTAGRPYGGRPWRKVDDLPWLEQAVTHRSPSVRAHAAARLAELAAVEPTAAAEAAEVRAYEQGEHAAHQAAVARLQAAAKAAGHSSAGFLSWAVYQLGLADAPAKVPDLMASLNVETLDRLAAALAPADPVDASRDALTTRLRALAKAGGWDAKRTLAWAKGQVMPRAAVDDAATAKDLWAALTIEELATLVGHLETMDDLEQAVLRG